MSFFCPNQSLFSPSPLQQDEVVNFPNLSCFTTFMFELRSHSDR